MGILGDALGFFGLGSGQENPKPTRTTAGTKQAPTKVSPIRPQRTNYSGAAQEMVTIDVNAYSDVKTIGEYFREDLPIVINIGELSEKDSIRVMDFVFGLNFGRHGKITRVTPKVFLLTPEAYVVNGDSEEDSEDLLDSAQ